MSGIMLTFGSEKVHNVIHQLTKEHIMTSFNWHATPPGNKWVYFRGEHFSSFDFWCEITECMGTFQLVMKCPPGIKGSSMVTLPTKELAVSQAEKFIKRKAFK